MASDDESTIAEPASSAEKRRAPRARVDLAVQLKFGNMQQFLAATVEDLSESGVFLRNEHVGPDGQLRQVGQTLALQFEAGNRRVVEGIGRVARVVVADDSGRVPGLGVEFVELDPQSRQLIAAIVDIKLARPFGT